MQKLTKALLVAALLPVMAVAQDSTQFIKGTWKDLTNRAQKEHKPIFIDTYFEGCHACKDMEVKVFPRPEVKKYMEENFICTGYDVFKEQFGIDLCRKYFMRGFPTYLVISGDGQLLDRSSGYQEPDRFMAFLKNNIARYKAGKTLAGFGNSLSSKDPEFYKAMWNKDYKGGDKEEIVGYLAKQKDKLAESTFKVMQMAAVLPDDYREFYLKNRKAYLDRFGEELNTNIMDKLLKQDIAALPATLDKAVFDAFLQKQQTVYRPEDWSFVQMYYAENYLFKKCKDSRAFLEFATAHPDRNENRVRYMQFFLGAELAKDAALKAQYLKWAEVVVTADASLENLQGLVRMSKGVDQAQTRKFLGWVIDKKKSWGDDTTKEEVELKNLNI
ncbi:thioredoxin fold domain-containing protein [Chitinophaga sp. G-6-1-13]|uniref:Thioredoxin fold domain-containing protein n=1 Tax=Chitinophaga fulva TaxID=2728842 RepID=A0A848GG02_9BACT|nr:thioredoxin fold domain-containing protein [Chitinophaga fulva]NML37394.1 thioredoxin fold domain-containing protein [Chitinophaga fulva]